MFKKIVSQNEASTTLVDVFMLFQQYAMVMILISASVQTLLAFKDYVLVKVADGFVMVFHEKFPIP